MHPVRREILCPVAAYSTNELDITSPEGCSRQTLLEITSDEVCLAHLEEEQRNRRSGFGLLSDC